MLGGSFVKRAGGALAISLIGCLLWSPLARADTSTYFCTATEQAFIVPAGVTTVHVVAVGARGGTGTANTNTGALGAESSADFSVTPGQLLYVEVGCIGGNGSMGTGGAGGFNGGGAGGSSADLAAGNGGGGGGGASDVRTSPRFAIGTLGSRLVIAAGGGASGGGSGGFGAAGPGGLTGGNGGMGNGIGGGAGGTGATQVAPGGTGLQMGALGLGGPGEAGTATTAGGGGGGGAGLFGGGGGKKGANASDSGGGGGGGSSGVAAGITNFSIGPAATGTPSVTFTYAPLVTPAAVASPTGQRARAIRKCKKKFPKGEKRRRCIKRAKRLPV
ncbi:MAG: glycine-rich protein [Solirubrobacterales bacterium]